MLKYQKEYIPEISVHSLRKSMVSYERIEKGLEPSIIDAIAFYKDEDTDNELLFEVFPSFKEWLDAGITISEMNSVGRTRDKVNNLMVSKLRLAKSEVSLIEYLKIEVGSIATKKQWKENIQKYYDYLGALKKAKATDLNEFCVMRETRRLVDDQIIKLLVVEEIL